jgi:hypothetical protein
VSLLWMGLVLGCGRRGAPAPLHPAPAVVVQQATLDEAGLAVTLAVAGAPGLTVQRAEVALWQAGQVVETTHTEGTLVVLFADGVPGVFRLTGSVYGSYWPGQREIITLDVSGEVNP